MSSLYTLAWAWSVDILGPEEYKWASHRSAALNLPFTIIKTHPMEMTVKLSWSENYVVGIAT